MTGERILAQAKLKCTEQRLAMLKFLEENGQPVTAEDVARALGSAAHVSTVYRFLGTLADKGLLLREIHQDGVARYRFAHEKHGHMLTCRVCHHSVDLPDCPLTQMQRQLEQQTGYRIMGHLLEFTGVCPACAEKTETAVHEKEQNRGKIRLNKE